MPPAPTGSARSSRNRKHSPRVPAVAAVPPELDRRANPESATAARRPPAVPSLRAIALPNRSPARVPTLPRKHPMPEPPRARRTKPPTPPGFLRELPFRESRAWRDRTARLSRNPSRLAGNAAARYASALHPFLLRCPERLFQNHLANL